MRKDVTIDVHVSNLVLSVVLAVNVPTVRTYPALGLSQANQMTMM